MSDLVAWLRAGNLDDRLSFVRLGEAADEIERLTGDVKQLHAICDRNDAEIERLRNEVLFWQKEATK